MSESSTRVRQVGTLPWEALTLKQKKCTLPTCEPGLSQGKTEQYEWPLLCHESVEGEGDVCWAPVSLLEFSSVGLNMDPAGEVRASLTHNFSRSVLGFLVPSL